MEEVIDSKTMRKIVMGDASDSGKIFTVTFEKKDGSLRTMNCRGRVYNHLAGGQKTWEPRDFNMINVWDIHNRGYRTVNANTVKVLKHRGFTFLLDK